MKQLNNLKSFGKSILFVLFCSSFFCFTCHSKRHRADLYVKNCTNDTLIVKWRIGGCSGPAIDETLPPDCLVLTQFKTFADKSFPLQPNFENLMNPEISDTTSFLKVFSKNGKLLKEWSYRMGNITSPDGFFNASSLVYSENMDADGSTFRRWEFRIKPEDLSLQHSN